MSSSIKKQIIDALKDQREIFGDDLFEQKPRKTDVVSEKLDAYTAQENLFPVDEADRITSYNVCYTKLLR